MNRAGRDRPRALATAMIVLAAAAARASDARADPPRARIAVTDELRDDAAVTVTARRAPERVQESDRSVAIVSAETIAQTQPRSMPEALRDVPGVAFQSTNRGSGAPILRGLIGPRNLLLYDGIRLNQAHWRTGPLQYLAQFDPWAVERLEVQFGPGSVAYGSDAMGGVVQALPFGMPLRDGVHANVRVGVRSADSGFESAGEISGRSRAFAARVGGSYRSYELLRVGRGGLQPYSDYRSFGMRAQTWIALGPEVTVGLAYVNSGVLGAGRADLLGNGRLTRTDNVDHLAYMDLRVRPASSPLRELRAVFALHATDEQVRQTDCDTVDGSVADARGCLAGARSTVNRLRAFRDAVITPGGYVTAAIGRPRDRARLVAGADAYLDLVDSARTTAQRPDFAPSARERGNFSSGSTYATLGAFAQGELDVIGAADARDRIVASGGARVVGILAHAPDVPMAGTVDYRAAGAVGSASLRYLRGRALTTYLSWSQGLRAPNLQETTLLGSEGSAYVIPSQTLGPERSNSFEAGVRAQLGPVRFSLAGYVSLVDGVIVREDVSRDQWAALGVDPTEVGGLRVQRHANAAWARYTGAEAWGSVRLVPGLTLWAQASAVRGDVFDTDGSQQPAQKTPPPLGAFGLRFERGGAYIELFSRWALPQDRLNSVDRSDLRICEDPAQIGRVQSSCGGTAGWITVNARAGYRFSPGLRTDLVLENLTDTRYRYHASGVDEPGVGVIVSLSGSL